MKWMYTAEKKKKKKKKKKREREKNNKIGMDAVNNIQ